MLYAYQLLDHQLIGAPVWTSSTGFDITGTYPPGRAATDHDVRLMVQKLLSDRFGLAVHREQREVPTYLLVLARPDGRLGPQLRRSDVDCEKWIAEKRPKTDAGGPNALAARTDIGAAGGENNAGRELGKLPERPAVEGHIDDRLVFDHLAD